MKQLLGLILIGGLLAGCTPGEPEGFISGDKEGLGNPPAAKSAEPVAGKAGETTPSTPSTTPEAPKTETKPEGK